MSIVNLLGFKIYWSMQEMNSGFICDNLGQSLGRKASLEKRLFLYMINIQHFQWLGYS